MLGARLGQLEPGKCEIVLPFKKAFTQQHGFFHGGVIATLADNSAGFAAYSLMEDGYQPLTIEFKLNLLTPGIGKLLISRAKVIKPGNRIFHCQANIFCVDDNQEQLISISLATIKSSKSVIEQ